MIYLLDTNACITFLRNHDSTIARRLVALPRDSVVTCAVVNAELYFGAHRSNRAAHSLSLVAAFLENFRSLPFDDAAARIYGKLRADLATQGNLIGPNDLLIASIALTHQATLVTHNTGEFSRIAGLIIEDWEI